MSLPFGTVVSAFAALAVVLGLVLLAARFAHSAGLARVGRGGGVRGRLRVEDALPLDRARRLLLVRCDGRDLLLLTGGAADVVVGWVPDPGTVKS